MTSPSFSKFRTCKNCKNDRSVVNKKLATLGIVRWVYFVSTGSLTFYPSDEVALSLRKNFMLY